MSEESRSGQRLRAIAVDGLFGNLRHEIRLNTDERLTVIHGPNGVGKTTILRLIALLFTSRFDAMHRIPFQRLDIEFFDYSHLIVTKKNSEDQEHATLKMAHTGPEPGARENTQTLKPFALSERIAGHRLALIEELLPHLDRIGPRQWYDRTTGDALSLMEVHLRYGDMLPAGVINVVILEPWLKALLDSMRVHYVETQRLLSRDRGPTRRTPQKVTHEARVTEYARGMAVKIQEALRQAGTVATSLDRTFPSRLLKQQAPPEATEGIIRSKYEEQSQYRKRLMDAGLLQAEDLVALPEGALGHADLRVLWYYLEDVECKLSVYSDLLARVELFQQVITDKRFIKKTLMIDKDSGIGFVGEDGSPVPLTALSSGEQHEIVLAYELLFLAEKNSLILIDEPELSLHVTWQHRFLDDMDRIANVAGLDFVIATHSPAIVHKRTRLMVELTADD